MKFSIRIILIILSLSYFVLGIPLTVNFQFVARDNSGNPISFNNENITFSFINESGATVWTETNSFSSPYGIINTALGLNTPILSSVINPQSDLTVAVTKAGGDTLLKAPFNSVLFAFKAGFSDSTLNSGLLNGKSLFDIQRSYMLSDSILTISLKDSISALRGYVAAQNNSVKSSVRLEIRDSIASHPSADPSGFIRDTANIVRGQTRSWIGDSANTIRSYAMARTRDTAATLRNYSIARASDTASALRTTLRSNISDSAISIRTYAITQDNGVKTTIRSEIRDSIAAHPGADPSNAIRDTANTVRAQARGWIGDSANTIRPYAIARISDTATTLRTYSSAMAGDTASALRTTLRANIGDSAISIRAYGMARISDTATTLRNYSIARAGDTASMLRTTLRSNIGDTANAIRTKVRADMMDSIRNYNNTYRIYLGSIGVGAETIHPPTDKYLLFDVLVINSSTSTSYKYSYAFNSTGQFAQIYPFAGGVLDPYYNLLPPAPAGKINFMYTVSTNTLSFNNNLASGINIYVSISEVH